MGRLKELKEGDFPMIWPCRRQQ